MKVAAIVIVTVLVGAGAMWGYTQANRPEVGETVPPPQVAPPTAQPEPAPKLMCLGDPMVWRDGGWQCVNVKVEKVPEGERFTFEIVGTDSIHGDMNMHREGFDMIEFSIRRPHTSNREKPGELLWGVQPARTPVQIDYQRLIDGKPFSYKATVPTEILDRYCRVPNLIWFGRFGFGLTSFEINYLPGVQLTRADAEKNLDLIRWPKKAPAKP